MILRKLVFTFFAGYFVVSINAQDSIRYKANHLIGIYSGYSHHIIRDDIASPLIYSGSNAPLLLSYYYRGELSRQFLSISYDNLELNSSITDMSAYQPHYANNIIVRVDYSYDKEIYNNKDLLVQCFLGGKFSNILNLRNFHYYNGNSIFFTEELNSIGPSIFVEKQFKRFKNDIMHFTFYFPVLSYTILGDRYNAVVAEESFNNLNLNQNIYWHIFKRGSFVSFNKLIEFQTELSYTKFISKHIGFEFQQKLLFYDYAHYRNLLHARYVNNQYLFGLIIKL
jgi:hypothetical protein